MDGNSFSANSEINYSIMAKYCQYLLFHFYYQVVFEAHHVLFPSLRKYLGVSSAYQLFFFLNRLRIGGGVKYLWGVSIKILIRDQNLNRFSQQHNTLALRLWLKQFRHIFQVLCTSKKQIKLTDAPLKQITMEFL